MSWERFFEVAFGVKPDAPTVSVSSLRPETGVAPGNVPGEPVKTGKDERTAMAPHEPQPKK
ncbi:MAG: hypothetical protein U1E62_22165 [Alsobacter sp.]